MNSKKNYSWLDYLLEKYFLLSSVRLYQLRQNLYLCNLRDVLRLKSKTRVSSSNPGVASSNPRVMSSNSRVTNSNPRFRRLKARVA